MVYTIDSQKPVRSRTVQFCLTHLPPSGAYMHQWTGWALVQIMACRLFGTKPLPEPMMTYCQLDSWEQISVKSESELYHFHSIKCIWKCCLPYWWPFCPGGNDLREVQFRPGYHITRLFIHHLNMTVLINKLLHVLTATFSICQLSSHSICQ